MFCVGICIRLRTTVKQTQLLCNFEIISSRKCTYHFQIYSDQSFNVLLFLSPISNCSTEQFGQKLLLQNFLARTVKEIVPL